MLGHSELNSTQIYTQVATRQLKAIHTATHPGRSITARGRIAPDEPPSDPEILLAALDAEADEEEAGDDAGSEA